VSHPAIEHRLDPEPLTQGRRQNKTGVSHQRPIIESDLDAVQTTRQDPLTCHHNGAS